MPLARIFTHHPERTTVLSEQLQQQGYRVEVVGPEQKHLAPADLEIEFETCERADVLDRAADLATQLEADVAVASGVLQPQAVMESAAVPEAPVMPERDPEREFQAAFASPAELPGIEHRELPEMVDVPVMEQAPLPPVAFIDEPVAILSEPTALNETAKPADPVPYLAQLTPFGTPAIHAESEESLQADREPWYEAQPEVAQSAAAAPSFGQRGASFMKSALGGARSKAASMAVSLRERLNEYQKRAQVRSAEARAAREARLLDLEQRRAEAQQRALELETAREAAAARLVELVRQRDPGLHEERLREESLREESLREEARRSASAPVPLPQPATALGSLRHASIAMMKKVRRPMTPQLRAVLAGAAAVSALFVVGIILGAFSTRAPLANPASHSAGGGVTVQGGGVTVKTGGVTVKAGGPAAQAPPAKAPQPAATAAQTQAPATIKPSPRVAQSRQFAAAQGEEERGDDVVVRHFSRPVPTQKPKQAGQQAGLKHFSDLEN